MRSKGKDSVKTLLYLLLCITVLATPIRAANTPTATDRPAESIRAAETTVVSVDIEWDSLVFTYYAGSGSTWDAQTHSYQTTDGGWTDETATFTVTNHSDTGVLAGFSFEGNSGIRGTFSKTYLTLFADNDVATTQFGIDPDSAPITADGSLGQITVEIQPMATATDADALEHVLTDWLDSDATELAILLPPNADASMLSTLTTMLDRFSKPVSLTLGGITEISESAFIACKKLRSILLPDAVAVDSWAFQNCTELESAQLPCVQTVGMRAFESCSKLTDIDLPNAETVGEYAFATCTKLTAIGLPRAAEIGEYTFSLCRALPEITLPGLKSIPNGLFYDCQTLTSITFESVISKVGSGWLEGISTGEVVLTLHPEQGNIGSKTTRFGENGTFGGLTFREVRSAESPQN